MSTVYKYRSYCNEENTYVYQWGTSEPTLCPNDHANRSNITGTTTVQTITEQSVTATDSAPADGYYQMRTLSYNIPLGLPGAVSQHDISYPYDVYMWSINIMQSTALMGDTMSMAVAPDSVVALLATNAAIGDTTITVSATAFTYLTRGCEIFITDGTNTNSLGIITAISSVNSTVTFQNSLTNNFTAGSYIIFTAYPIKDMVFDAATDRLYIGTKGLKPKLVEAGQIIRVYYTNNSGVAKTLRIQLELFFK